VPSPVRLIVNPASGGGRGGRLAPSVLDELRRLGLSARREDTRDLDHARMLALDAAHRGEIVAASRASIRA
jgi:diacylglycerol kinase family enzyme